MQSVNRIPEWKAVKDSKGMGVMEFLHVEIHKLYEGGS
jgi:hypothetical protein